ncbi:VirD4-like conjugal transfer protein, CD1115 family [Tissierella praeacuta]|uniref:VirD4-like conjugal transfer protein, CD1115 family n=1 Tax=Tissierella praeacuta TaxID=43131 RepID=UPI0028A9E1D3|nr:type IV secretory system conjugative DNA transfer family protein [Tissierella praeacuta]
MSKIIDNIRYELSMIDKKKLFIKLVPYIFIYYIFNKIGKMYRGFQKDNFFITLYQMLLHLENLFKPPFPSFHPKDIAFGIIGALAIYLIVYTKGKNARKYRKGEEYGSARWGNPKDIRPYIDPIYEENIILTQTERLMMNGRPKNPKYARNKNVLVVGGSGSGKTRFYVKPNLMQMHSSYVVTDPKGTILLECGKLLERGAPKKKLDKNGKEMRDKRGKIIYERDKKGRIIYESYNIKVLNTINFKKSMHYNPFEYIRSEKDILKLVNTIIANTKGEGEKAGEDFWVKAEKLYYTALIGYIYYKAPKEEQNFSTLLEMINVSEAREDDENFKNPVDLLFDALEETEPDHFALRQYKKYKLAAGKTAKSILISCGARLAPFDIKELRDLMEYDEMELDTLGDRKTALFIIISDTDDTFNFIVAMMYTQLFNLLCDKADDVYGGRLPIHVRFLLDEFANIGQIPKFEKLIATIRSREISASIILQAQSQLKAIYKDNADTIIGNCDTMLFLGGKEKSTLKEISEVLGKETIDLYNQSENRGRERSYGTNYQKLGKELMSQDELAVMDSGKCILQLRGVRPFLSDKFDITRHRNYRYLSDYDEKNSFEIDKYLSKEWGIRGNEEVEIYEY